MKQSQALNIADAFQRTALETLRAIVGATRQDKHDGIVLQVSIIAALALAHEPPRAVGNPADHGKVARMLADAKLKRYAEALQGLSAALKHKGMRSCASWDDALQEGSAMVCAMLADCAPKVRTAEQQAAADKRKADKAAERKSQAAADEAAAKEAQDAALSAAFERGRAAVTVTADAVAAMIRAGAFNAAELSAIADALHAAPIDVSARTVPAVPALTA